MLYMKLYIKTKLFVNGCNYTVLGLCFNGLNTK